jgi:hypothetical protein
MSVGVIGLGAGTLAAYARKDDVYDFWDIDPKVIRVATNTFTYVAEALGRVNLILRDGRKALEESKGDYDLLVIDAFTGDGVPAHLLTREAISIYLRRLNARHGLLVVHASARYSRFFPVVEATARSLGYSAVDVTTNISDSTPDRDWDPTPTEYIIVCPPGQLKDIAAWFSEEEDKGRVKHKITTNDSPQIYTQFIWSDDRNASLDVTDFGRFLFGP